VKCSEELQETTNIQSLCVWMLCKAHRGLYL